MSAQIPDRKVPVERMPVVDSTNRLAKEAVESGRLKGPRFFVADRQTGAYGRFGRAWHSPEGGLWATLAWPVVNAQAGPVIDGLGLRIGVAVLGAVSAALARAGASPATVQLKWPNDVLIAGKKTAGVLCEATSTRQTTWLIIGIGVNVNNEAAELPAPLRMPATSLRAQAAQPINLEEFFDDLALRIINAIEPESFTLELVADAASRLYGQGKRVTLRLPDGAEKEGRLEGLSPDGRLMVLTDQGRFIAPHGTEMSLAPHPA
ncbi:MAG TPA: biotin--[acetyl-CoA-carboxylase] ligase [Phycisphaerales bacterium]|nr:biotin--[acetyl-CoA-carboxylase] ligase [Phycisphaerales bacterium]